MLQIYNNLTNGFLEWKIMKIADQFTCTVVIALCFYPYKNVAVSIIFIWQFVSIRVIAVVYYKNLEGIDCFFYIS